MSERTCATCKHFIPATNPATGRKLPSQPGKCNWPMPWPEQFPASYMPILGNWKPLKPLARPMYATGGVNCQTWEEK